MLERLFRRSLRLVCFAWFATSLCAAAQVLSTRDYAIEISASIQEIPPRITLNWRNDGDGQQFLVQRKAKGATGWQSGTVLSASASTYSDTNVVAGVEYEYGITKYPAPASAQSGYIDTGIRLPLIDSRGTVILIVDNTYVPDLVTELTRLQQDLVGDRWTVIRHDVARTNTGPTIKSLIKNDYTNDPGHVRAVLLFGHVAVPYSGNYNADDHPDHTGAWVADTYYGDMDNGWTDNTVVNTSATRLANRNVVGDGKFDQSVIPSDLEIEVGRVDFANLPAFLPRTEKDLLRDYLNKDHNFRHGIITAQRRALIFDGFGESGGEAYAASGWRNFAPFFGSAQITEVGSSQFFPTASSTDFLWAYVAGGGDANYTDCYFVGSTTDFANNNVKTIFNMVFGSYWIDWDATNDFFRATLGSGNALTVAGAGRPHWFFHHMAMGETIGYSTRLSQNNAGLYVPSEFTREVHISLLGDPTLRMHVVKPPSSLTATTNSGTVTLNWAASPDSNLQGYYVYRSNFFDGHFTAITNATPLIGLSFTDNVASGTYSYMVRAIKLESSSSGTYSNASQGIFVTTTVSSSNSPITLSQAGVQNGVCNFRVNGQVGTTFAIDRSTNLVQWTALMTNTLTGTTFNFADSPASIEKRRFYRTRTLP